MKLLGILTFMGLVSCAHNQVNNQMRGEMKRQVIELLNSIESGDKKPITYINPKKYIQHNLSVGDGLAGFGEALKYLPPNSAKVDIKRVFRDGNYVFTHTKYNFFGPKAGFDIFKFENGKIVEHWDNLQEIITNTASGRTQFDGPTEVKDIAKTEENKKLIKRFVSDVLFGKNPQKISKRFKISDFYPQIIKGAAHNIFKRINPLQRTI